MRSISWLARALVVALALRLAYLLAAHAYGAGDVRLYHLQAAATWFALAGLAYAWLRPAAAAHTPAAAAPARSPLWLAAYVGGSLLLYAPAIPIGALSDDFVLVERAMAWDLGPVTPILFRPLPLGLWAALLSLGGGTAALHALSIALHGLNAWLTSRLASRWLPHTAAHVAGVWMLVSPLHGESVVWLSGVFDVAATTAVLLAVLALRGYLAGPSPGRRLTFLLASIAALASKETAVVLPLLAAIAALPDRRRMPRAAAFDLAAVAALTLAYGATRAWNADAAGDILLVDRYALQRALFTSIGALAAPWRADEVSSPLVLAATVLLIALFARAFVAASRQSLQPIVVGGLWVLAAIAPVASSLVVGTNLEGARYLYAASVGWALAIAGLCGAGSEPQASARWPVAAVAVMAIHAAVGVRTHLGPWLEGARVRDVVLASAAGDPRLASCGTVRLTGLPDTVTGAYVFRNGAPEAFRRATGLRLDDAAAPECRFHWQPDAGFAPDAELR